MPEGCAHRARDGSIVSRFALDVEGDTVGSFRLDFEVGCGEELACGSDETSKGMTHLL